jgi:hypothetical protein
MVEERVGGVDFAVEELRTLVTALQEDQRRWVMLFSKHARVQCFIPM